MTTTIAEPKTKAPTKRPSHVEKRPNGRRRWSCPECSGINDGALLECLCGCIVKLPEGPDQLLVTINDCGVVEKGGRTIVLRIRKSSKVSVSLRIVQVADREWVYGYHFAGPMGRMGTSSAAPAVRDPHFESEEAAIFAGCEQAYNFIRKSQLPSLSKTHALADLETHARQLLGSFDLQAENQTAPASDNSAPAVHKRGGSSGKSAATTDIPETQAEASAKEAAANGHRKSIAVGKLTHGPQRRDQGETLDMPLVRIVEHPSNPRVDYGDLQELAKSLQAQGQLQECIGRRIGENVELLGGHRRYRAAKIAKLPTLRVHVVACDDVRARELLGLDNEQRENFDPVAKGRWFALMLEQDGLSQRQLADKLGVSQAAIANHVRLLSLPEPWRTRLITREITETHARAVVPFAGSQRALAIIEKTAWNQEYEGLQQASATQWPEIIANAIDYEGLPLTKGRRYSGHRQQGKASIWVTGESLFTPELIEQHRAELDVVELGTGKRSQLVALNSKRFLELQQELEAAQSAKGAKRSAKAEAKETQAAKTRTPAQEKQAREQRTRQLGEAVWKYKVRFLQTRVAEAIKTAEGYVGIKFLIGFAASEPNKMREPLAAALKARGHKPKTDMGWLQVWPSLVPIAADKSIVDLARDVLAAWLTIDAFEWNSPVREQDVVLMARELGIDFAKEWRVEQTFLALFRKEELAKLAAEWKLQKQVAAAGEKRGDQIAAILEADQAKRLPVPKCLQRKGQ